MHRQRMNRSLFTGQTVSTTRQMLGASLAWLGQAPANVGVSLEQLFADQFVDGSILTPPLGDLTYDDVSVLQMVHDKYTWPMASKKYEKIPTEFDAYANVLNQIKTFQVWETKEDAIQMMMNIVETGLLGSLNMGVLFMNNAYDEYKLNMLNKEEQDILTKKNQKSTMTSTEGQFTYEQNVFLSPLYNNYIYMYGMPKFGVGFDPDKLLFVEKLMRLVVTNNPTLLKEFFPHEVVNEPSVPLSDPAVLEPNERSVPVPVNFSSAFSSALENTDTDTGTGTTLSFALERMLPIANAWEDLSKEAMTQLIKKRKKKIDVRILSPTAKDFYDSMTKPA